MSNEAVTILHTTGGRHAQKVFIAGQAPRPYSAGGQFTFERREVDNLEKFAELLTEVEQDQTAFLVRGQPLPHLHGSATVFRRCRGEGAAFSETRTRLICVDVDTVEAPEGIDPCSDRAAEHVVSKLPSEFHGASYVRQFSSSAGLSGQSVKVHLWWWLDRSLTDVELRRWAEATAVADPKLYNPVQPHYTASPAFGGIDDPFEEKTRVAFIGKGNPIVSLVLPERYSPPKGARENVFSEVELSGVRDDTGKAIDGREGLLSKIRWCVLHNQHLRTEADYAAMVWNSFCDCAQTGPTTHSDNTYTKESVARSCSRDWQRWGAISPEPVRCMVSADVASLRMTDAIRQALSEVGCTAIKATPGLGKSVVTATEIVALPDIEDRYIEIYAPTRKQQAEWCDRLNIKAAAAGKKLSVIPIFGRDVDNCPKHELAAELARNDIPVTPSLCRGKVSGVAVQCEHYELCRYRAQFANTGPAIRIFSHAHLSTPRPKKVKPPSVIVIDESFAPSLVDISAPQLIGALKITLGGMRAPMRRPRASEKILKALPEAEQTIRQTLEAIQSNGPLLDELRVRGVMPECLRNAADVVSARAPLPGLHPGKTDAAFRVEAKNGLRRRFVLVVRALRALAVELATSRRFSHAVKWVDPDKDAKLCVTKNAARLWDFETILILDADYEPLTGAALLPNVKCVTIDARQNARFVQIEDLSFSKHYLGLGPGDSINPNVIQKLAGQIRKLPGTDKLLVTYKALVPHLKEQLSSVQYIHFGGLRGTNDFENCDTAVIVGRNFPPADAIEDIARALHYASPKPLLLAEPVPRRNAVGKGVLRSYDYLDERLQAVLRAMREAETRQAIGRLRSVHAKEPKLIYIFSSQPTGIAVDRLVAFEPSKGERLFEKLGGILPMNPGDLSRLAGAEEFPRGGGQAQKWETARLKPTAV